MRIARLSWLLPVAGALWVLPALAADPVRCLSPEQRRGAIAAHRALPLAQAIAAVKARAAGEVVRARLCEGSGGLVYMLTVLARDGKVIRATVDAANGNLLSGR
jgi:uncharacterized membrane protein YkoI